MNSGSMKRLEINGLLINLPMKKENKQYLIPGMIIIPGIRYNSLFYFFIYQSKRTNQSPVKVNPVRSIV